MTQKKKHKKKTRMLKLANLPTRERMAHGDIVIPADIEHACIEMVGERYRYKNRIGEVSKSLGGQETMAFSQKDMPDYIRTLLQPYRRVVLV